MDTSDSPLVAHDGPDIAVAARAEGRRGPALGLYAAFGKRAFDIIAVLLSSVLIVPMLAMLMALIALDGGKPLFRQKRVGRDGRSFTILKLRTMVPDAERQLERHLDSDPRAAREWRERQKLRDDPRVTPLGRLLRCTSMDELPQLWNVLRGDMSLVGPRPMMESQRGLYPGTAYYSLRPGITGPWQVSARHASSFAARAEYDRAYRDGLGLWSDLRLLWRTVWVVLRGTGV